MTPDLPKKYNLQQLDISSDWTVVRNVFYNIDPFDLVSEDDKHDYLYCQQDLLLLTRGDYHLDLGWYGYDDLTNDATGFCIHLFRGDNWNNAILLEKFRSKSQIVIVNKINELAKAVNMGVFDNLSGHKVDENDSSNKNDFSDFDTYSVRIM
jgi:hypothetical protein